MTDPKISRSISEETGAEMLLFHSCHNLSKADFESGATYLSLMKQNVENLKKDLNNYMILSCRDVTVAYDSKIAVDHVSFEVNEGEYVCIVGENGSEKAPCSKAY